MRPKSKCDAAMQWLEKAFPCALPPFLPVHLLKLLPVFTDHGESSNYQKILPVFTDHGDSSSADERVLNMTVTASLSPQFFCSKNLSGQINFRLPRLSKLRPEIWRAATSQPQCGPNSGIDM
jgi:hypothetical protein